MTIPPCVCRPDLDEFCPICEPEGRVRPVPARRWQSELDPWIRDVVIALTEHCVETFESCEGGEGHCFPEPTVRFHGGNHEGFRALSVALMLALPVWKLRLVWTVTEAKVPDGPVWEMTFRLPDGYVGAPYTDQIAAREGVS